MLKEALTSIGVGSACLSAALVSTHFSGSESSSNKFFSPSKDTGKKITTISSYGDIDAYGLQNGCFFRIVDKDESKVYTLTDFLTEKRDKFPTLEDDVVKIAKSGTTYCGKEIPIVTIFYEKVPPIEFLCGDIDIDVEIDKFRFEKSPIITEKERK